MVVGRLAPSPTGAQHLGNARTFLVAWLSIRSQGGKILLRIEDIDSPRVKPDSLTQAIEDLQWLGLDWDDGPAPDDYAAPDDGLSPWIQSNRMERYKLALERLQAGEKVYPCTCSRKDIQEAASAPHESSDGPVYGGTCAARKVNDGTKLQQPFAWRFRVEDHQTRFVDRFAGEKRISVANSLGDFVVYRNDGTPAYQLAVVVDDHEMGVSEVIRGDDLIPSTFRQLELFRFFGWRPPEFGHVPLVVGPDGRRLAKRHGDTRLASFRNRGVTAGKIIGLLAFSLGWLKHPEEVLPGELIDRFEPGRIPQEPWVVGAKEIAWLLGGTGL